MGVKVGDKIRFLRGGRFITKDKIYTVVGLSGGDISFIDDAGDRHWWGYPSVDYVVLNECDKCGSDIEIEAIGSVGYDVCECAKPKEGRKTDRDTLDLIVNLAREVASLKQRLREVERQSIANERDVRTFAEDLTEIKYRGGCV